MASIINQFSFVLTALILFGTAVFLIFRTGRGRRQVIAAGSLAIAILLAWLWLRPSGAVFSTPEEVRTQLASGTPVLLEFQSPY